MQPDPAAPKQSQPDHAAVQHVGEAHRLLQGLRERLETHPELEQAIEELEMALSVLAVKTGGML